MGVILWPEFPLPPEEAPPFCWCNRRANMVSARSCSSRSKARAIASSFIVVESDIVNMSVKATSKGKSKLCFLSRHTDFLF